MALQAEMDNAQYQRCNEILASEGAEEVKSISEATSLQNIKNAASKFQEALVEYNDNIKNFEILLQQQQEKLQEILNQQGNDAIDELVTQYCTQKDTLARKMTITEIGQKVYSALFAFQDKLNEFMGQKTQLAYVLAGENESSPKIYIDIPDLSQFLTYEGRNVNGELNQVEARFRENDTTLRYIEEHLTEYGPDNSKGGLIELNTVHQDALSKYNEYHNKTGLIMWLSSYPPPKWGKMKVNNKGAINEGYARAVFLRQVQYFSGMTEYHSRLEFFMLNYVYASDTTPGALIGDINNGIGSLQIAVKGADAQTITIHQMETLASMVLQDDFSKAKLEAYIQKEMETSHSLTSLAEDYTLEDADRILSAICDSVGATRNW